MDPLRDSTLFLHAAMIVAFYLSYCIDGLDNLLFLPSKLKILDSPSLVLKLCWDTCRLFDCIESGFCLTYEYIETRARSLFVCKRYFRFMYFLNKHEMSLLSLLCWEVVFDYCSVWQSSLVELIVFNIRRFIIGFLGSSTWHPFIS